MTEGHHLHVRYVVFIFCNLKRKGKRTTSPFHRAVYVRV